MKLNVYKLVTLLFLCFSINSFAQCPSLPYDESFENGLASWTNDPNNDINWAIGTGNVIGSNGASDGNYFTYISNTSTSIAQTGILSTCLDLTNCSASNINFDYFFNGTINQEENGTFSLEVSTNNGTSWQTFWDLQTLSTSTWVSTASINLNFNQYLGQIIQVRFKRTSEPNAARSFGIDNLNITCTADISTPIYCSDVTINISPSTSECNTFCGTFTTSAADPYNININISTTNTFPPSSSIIPITDNDIDNVSVTNGILSGTFCITLDESDFNLDNSYILTAGIVTTINGEECRSSTSLSNLTIEECEIECPPIKEVVLEEGFFLTWDPEIQAEGYTFLFTINAECKINFSPDEMTQYTIHTADNFIDMREWPEKFDKCITYKIISDCGSETPWCTIKWTGDYYEFLSGNCLDEGRPVINEIKATPNPTTDIISISSEKLNISSIAIYNIHGKAIQTFSKVNMRNQQINLGNLPKGYYVIKIYLENGTIEYKNIILD